MSHPIEPTPEQCSANAIVSEDDRAIAMACWYPQMGGYVGRAIACMHKDSDSCFDVYVWHDGEFPFSDDGPNSRPPAQLHHCDPAQFVAFGEALQSLQARFVSEDPEG
jgi:hypothetical protein